MAHDVLFLIPTLGAGGAERVLVTLLRHLDRTKFRPTLGVVDLHQAAFRGDVPPDVELIELGGGRVRYAVPSIVRVIWERRPRIVFSTLGHLNLALATLRPLLPRDTRFVARETGILTEVNRARRRPYLWDFGYRNLYGRLDAVVCQSDYMRDDLVENFGVPREIARVIRNPVDLPRIRRLAFEPVATGLEPSRGEGRHRPVQLVAVGRLSREKGFDILIEALALCGDSRFRLTIVGRGPLRAELETLARRAGVHDRVTFAGFQRNVYPFLAQANLFVLSSRHEAFPNVVLEAMACGTPVVATPAPGGVREILRDVPGCVMASSVSAAALAEAIVGASTLPRLSEAVGEPYSAARIASEYAAMFTALVAAPPRRDQASEDESVPR